MGKWVAFFLKNNFFLAFIAIVFLLLGFTSQGFLFSWAAWFFIFLILLNSKNGYWGVVGLLGWSALIGYVYCAVALVWLTNFSLAVYILSVLAVFPAFVLYLSILFWARCFGDRPVRDALFAGLVWLMLGWIYGLTPFSGVIWQLPFCGPSPFLQTASLIGYEIFSAVLLALNFSLAVFIKRRDRQAGKVALVLALGVLLMGGWGIMRPMKQPPADLKIALIQHNLPIAYAGKPSHAGEILEKCRQLAKEALKSNPDLIIFPQYTVTSITLKSPAFFQDLARELKKYILFSSHIPIDKNPDPHSYPRHVNAGILIGPSGNVVDVYQAIRAPFTEKGVKRSKKYKVLDAPFGKIGVLLCYEDLFSSVAKKATDAGAEFLVALSNPGNFSGSFLPEQHLLQDRLRSIESDRYLVKVSPNGYSAVVDPSGRILKKTRLYQEEIMIVDIARKKSKTLFHRIFYYIPLLFLFLIPGVVNRKNKEKSPPNP